ncbi:hypothetical protein AVEN_209952-1 [Araneus ventricosus]|uniref:Uncharacterized protein n=1 Tax=Araneus ventricosus TaxID=182803 RepID=A0A4Y2DB83_ARAVE|nr:hypothetical protein AVEN_209952-1 [Araneus ventricosus]
MISALEETTERCYHHTQRGSLVQFEIGIRVGDPVRVGGCVATIKRTAGALLPTPCNAGNPSSVEIGDEVGDPVQVGGCVAVFCPYSKGSALESSGALLPTPYPTRQPSSVEIGIRVGDPVELAVGWLYFFVIMMAL